jgi:hypothetical protein
MIAMYCRDHHRRALNGLCEDCRQLLDYAMDRIDKCPFCLSKPTCANCPIHCYKKDRREEVRAVMRYAGPRMMRRHPVLAIMHMLDGYRSAELPVRKSPARRPGDARDRNAGGT